MIYLFVVGMYRSGTTLTEHILGSHSKIRPGGEQAFWTQRAAEFLRFGPGRLVIDDDLVKQLAGTYLSLVDPGQPHIRYVTDKNPGNIHLAMLLHCIYPNAKILHIKRNPVDNLLSMWMTPFDETVRFASNRENLVFAYRDYMRLYKHLEEVLPSNRFKTVCYEDLTSDPRKTVANTLNYLDLNEEAAQLLEPEKPRGQS